MVCASFYSRLSEAQPQADMDTDMGNWGAVDLVLESQRRMEIGGRGTSLSGSSLVLLASDWGLCF